MKRTVFVTGASGFVGRVVCEKLVARGYRVKALTRGAAPATVLPDVEWVAGDLLKPESFAASLVDCEALLHLGGDPTFGNGAHYAAINTQATERLLRLAESVPTLRHFLFTSTIGAVDRAAADDCRKPLTEVTEPHPSSDYGRSKLAAEQLVLSAKVPGTVFRLGLVVGRKMRDNSHVRVFVKTARKGGLLSRFDLPGRFSLVHVDDVAEALCVSLFDDRTHRQTYFLTGPAASLADIWSWAGGRSPRVPMGFVRAMLQFSFPLFALFRRILPFKLKALFLDSLVADNGKLRALGWSPKISAEAMVSEIRQSVVALERAKIFPENWCWVTGAASGLGAALSRQLAESGRKLLLIDRNAASLETVAAECRAQAKEVQTLVCDLAHPDFLSVLQGAAAGAEPDELFLCAGFGARGRVLELSEQSQTDMIRVNFEARTRIARWGAMRMKERGYGRIVLISSSSAFQPLPLMSVYAATNAAVLLYGEALSAELREHGITVTTVCPGGMRTSFQASAGVKVLENDRLASPESIAAAILRATFGGKATLVVGPRSKEMALLSRLLPRTFQLALWKRMMMQFR